MIPIKEIVSRIQNRKHFSEPKPLLGRLTEEEKRRLVLVRTDRASYVLNDITNRLLCEGRDGLTWSEEEDALQRNALYQNTLKSLAPQA